MHPAEVKLLSAVGMHQVLLDLGPGFERATGHKLAVTFDAFGLIMKRTEGGETVDVVGETVDVVMVPTRTPDADRESFSGIGPAVDGRAEIALHQVQELLAVPGIEIVGPFPAELQERFVFSAGVMLARRGRRRQGAD